MSKGNIQYILSHNPYLPDSKVGLFPNTIKVQECNNSVISKKNADYISIWWQFG